MAEVARFLGADTIAAVLNEVAQAKDRGWSQDDLRRWFGSQNVSLESYKAALAGEEVAQMVAAVMSQVSITGLPSRALAPNLADIKRHIEWLIEPARGDYDDALFEIAWQGSDGFWKARLFDFDEVDKAVSFAAERNAEERNIYIGAAMRLPDTNRFKRCSAADFYVGTAVPIDIDENYEATRAKLAEACDDGLTVVTGTIPTWRSQHWTRLQEPCDEELEYGQAFASLVMHTGADMKVKDPARIMRLGGTVSYPDERKIAKNYIPELTKVIVRADAAKSSLDKLKALTPSLVEVGKFDSRSSGGTGEIERDWTGRVINGRESYFRDLLLKHLRQFQESYGGDPEPEHIFETAFEEFNNPRNVNNEDQRWTSPAGQQQLMHRAQNTIRRLRQGRLARLGIHSYDTGVGEEEAEAVRQSRAAAMEARKKPEEPYVEPSKALMAMSVSEPSAGDAEGEPGPIRASDFHGEPPARRWVVEDWIVEGAVNSLYGDGGLGKTLLAQQLACSVSIGATWLGMKTVKGPVLAVLCEDDEGELHRRHNDIKAAMGYSVGNPFSDVWLWPRVGFDNVLVRWDRDGRATLGPFVEALVQQITDKQPSLVVLDTLADFYGGNEIDRVQVNYFVKVVLGGLIAARKAQGAPLTVLLLGHPSVAGKSSGSGYSGSTAWNNAVRSRIYLTRPEEGAGDERLLTRGKANYAKSGDETGVRLFYEGGVLHAAEDVEDGDSVLWGAMRDAAEMVRSRWDSGSPYNDRKDHDRFIHKALVTDLMHSGYKPAVARQAVRECIEDGKIKSGASNGKRGYRCL